MKPIAIVGGVLAGVAAVVLSALFAFSPGVSALTRASEPLKGQNIAMQADMTFVENGEKVRMVGKIIRDAGGTRVRMEVETTIKEGTIHQSMLVLGDDVWVDTHEGRELMPAGTRWVHMVERSPMVGQMTLADYIDFLADSEGVEDLGETTLNGHKVTHYRGKISAKELADRVGGQTDANFEQMLGARDLKAPVEAWIREDGHVERVISSASAGGSSVVAKFDAVDYGVKTNFNPPAKSETISEAKFDEITAE